MRKTHFWAILAIGSLLAGSEGLAQQAPGAAPAATAHVAPAGGIAVLDVSYVFKHHPRFKALMEQLQAEAAQAEATLKQKGEALKTEAQQLSEYKSGLPDFKEREAGLMRRQSELATEVNLQKRDFMQREAKIYNSVYEEMMQEVDYLAKSSNIAMVMRFNGDPVDAQKPDDVVRRINQPIVWYPKDRDITPIILERLIARAGGANPAVTPNAVGNNTGTRPGIPSPQMR